MDWNILGLAMLTKAEEAAPENPDIVFHAASALEKSGQTWAARKKLEAILKKHEQFSLRNEAESLLTRLTAN
jgi:hypothetical protein